jgi:hypothetical protein
MHCEYGYFPNSQYSQTALNFWNGLHLRNGSRDLAFLICKCVCSIGAILPVAVFVSSRAEDLRKSDFCSHMPGYSKLLENAIRSMPVNSFSKPGLKIVVGVWEARILPPGIEMSLLVFQNWRTAAQNQDLQIMVTICWSWHLPSFGTLNATKVHEKWPTELPRISLHPEVCHSPRRPSSCQHPRSFRHGPSHRHLGLLQHRHWSKYQWLPRRYIAFEHPYSPLWSSLTNLSYFSSIDVFCKPHYFTSC